MLPERGIPVFGGGLCEESQGLGAWGESVQDCGVPVGEVGWCWFVGEGGEDAN